MRTNERPPNTFQTTAIGIRIPAMFITMANQLAGRNRDIGQLKKKQVTKIKPDRGMPATNIRTRRASHPTQFIHEGSDTIKSRCQSVCLFLGLGPISVVLIQGIMKAVIDLLP